MQQNELSENGIVTFIDDGEDMLSFSNVHNQFQLYYNASVPWMSLASHIQFYSLNNTDFQVNYDYLNDDDILI